MSCKGAGRRVTCAISRAVKAEGGCSRASTSRERPHELELVPAVALFYMYRLPPIPPPPPIWVRAILRNLDWVGVVRLRVTRIAASPLPAHKASALSITPSLSHSIAFSSCGEGDSGGQ